MVVQLRRRGERDEAKIYPGDRIQSLIDARIEEKHESKLTQVFGLNN